jgi:hypothetical protein
MFKYSVEVAGKTVWSGEGEDDDAIPVKYRTRPPDAAPGAPHTPAFHWIRDGQEFAVLESLAEYIDPNPVRT